MPTQSWSGWLRGGWELSGTLINKSISIIVDLALFLLSVLLAPIWILAKVPFRWPLVRYPLGIAYPWCGACAFRHMTGKIWEPYERLVHACESTEEIGKEIRTSETGRRVWLPMRMVIDFVRRLLQVVLQITRILTFGLLCAGSWVLYVWDKICSWFVDRRAYASWDDFRKDISARWKSDPDLTDEYEDHFCTAHRPKNVKNQRGETGAPPDDEGAPGAERVLVDENYSKQFWQYGGLVPAR